MIPDAPHRLRVLLVGENDDYWDGMCQLLAAHPALRVVGRAHSSIEAVERARELTPDLVLLDATLPDGPGFAVARPLKALAAHPMVVILTFHASQAAVDAALAAGADRCMAKDEIASRLLASIRGTLSGPALFEPHRRDS